MIRQAISCDVCGAEKKQTNHWFVAFEQAGELRLGGWNSRNKQRPGTKHLCGQTCLHKLVDEYIARTIDGRSPVATAHGASRNDVDTSLTSPSAFPVRAAAPLALQVVVPEPPPVSRREEVPISTPVVPFPLSSPLQPSARAAAPQPPDEPPQYASRRWRAEAWERERIRELRSIEGRPRHKSQ